jgi:hypothetical protein
MLGDPPRRHGIQAHQGRPSPLKSGQRTPPRFARPRRRHLRGRQNCSNGPSAGLIVVGPVVVVVRTVFRGGSALTGRGSRHSTAGLTLVAAARLVVAHFDEGVGHSHPQSGSERGVVGGPVGQECPWAWFLPRFSPGCGILQTLRPVRSSLQGGDERVLQHVRAPQRGWALPDVAATWVTAVAPGDRPGEFGWRAGLI